MGGIVFMQSLHVSTIVMNSNPAHGEVYSIQHSVINLPLPYDRPVVFSKRKEDQTALFI
jgi:hypothetical protein